MLLLLWDWPGGLVFTLLLVSHLMVKTSEPTAVWGGREQCPLDREWGVRATGMSRRHQCRASAA